VKQVLIILSFFSAFVGFSANAIAQQGVINLEEEVIKGRIQKPEAFYILQNANLNYEMLKPKQSFIPELLKTAEQKPF
jgi:hypothetical protein